MVAAFWNLSVSHKANIGEASYSHYDVKRDCQDGECSVKRDPDAASMADAGVPEFGNRIATEDEAQHKGRVGQGDSHSHAFGPNITDAKWYETQVRHQKTELEAEKA